MQSEILDDTFIEKKVAILSKLSILIIGLALSPLLAGMIYCFNLYQTQQKDKIFSTIVAIATINFIATVPFMGFKLEYNNFNLVFYIHHFITTPLIVFPLWKKHFKIRQYNTHFPLSIAIFIVLFMLASFLLNGFIFYIISSFLFVITVKFIYVFVNFLMVWNRNKFRI
jgi:hypothetical protein